MSWFNELFSNELLIAGFSAWFVAQILKTIIDLIIHKEFDWWRLVGDGGMPSGHSATVTSVAITSGLIYGLGSYEFGIATIVAVIVCHDAMGVRRETGKQAKVLNEIIESFDILSNDSVAEVKLKELVGHTPIQVFFGILLGIAVSLFVVWFLG